jgi:hypothetical protein
VSDRAGSVVATWYTSTDRLRAVYDAAPPMLAAWTIPASAVVGVPATFAATFLDPWSAVPAPPAWLAGIDAVACRCGNGLALAACAGETLPRATAKKFGAACAAVETARAGTGRKARKAASKAAAAFKKPARRCAGRRPARCRPSAARR